MKRKAKYGVRIYLVDKGWIRVEQTIKSGTGHNDRYRSDMKVNRERYMSLRDDAKIAQAVRDALAGKLRSK